MRKVSFTERQNLKQPFSVNSTNFSDFSLQQRFFFSAFGLPPPPPLTFLVVRP